MAINLTVPVADNYILHINAFRLFLTPMMTPGSNFKYTLRK